MLKALGWSAAGLASGALALPSLAHAQKPKYGGTIKIGSFSNIDTLDAHNTTSIVACSIHNNIYNGLLKIVSSDGKGVDFKPELAREWEIQGDRVHVFRLHKGVTFHNGDPCTAADVKWNLERVKDKSAVAHPRLEAGAARGDRDARQPHGEAPLQEAVSVPPRRLHGLDRSRRHHPQSRAP